VNDHAVLGAKGRPVGCKACLQGFILLCTDFPGLLESELHILSESVIAPLCLNVPTGSIPLPPVRETLQMLVYSALRKHCMSHVHCGCF
jgi:hypothetical protein